MKVSHNRGAALLAELEARFRGEIKRPLTQIAREYGLNINHLRKYVATQKELAEERNPLARRCTAFILQSRFVSLLYELRQSGKGGEVIDVKPEPGRPQLAAKQESIKVTNRGLKMDSAKPLLMTVEEICRRATAEKAERLRRGRWGAWRIVKSRQVLSINRSYLYEVDLNDIKRDGPLHWFAHLREKAWLQRGDIEDLIMCFDDLFGCSWIWNNVFGRRERGK